MSKLNDGSNKKEMMTRSIRFTCVKAASVKIVDGLPVFDDVRVYEFQGTRISDKELEKKMKSLIGEKYFIIEKTQVVRTYELDIDTFLTVATCTGTRDADEKDTSVETETKDEEEKEESAA